MRAVPQSGKRINEGSDSSLHSPSSGRPRSLACGRMRSGALGGKNVAFLQGRAWPWGSGLGSFSRPHEGGRDLVARDRSVIV